MGALRREGAMVHRMPPGPDDHKAQRGKPMISEPLGEKPTLQKPRSDSGAQTDQMGVGSSIAAAANDLVSGGGSAAS